MEGFFSGSVILLYMVARNASEYLFLSSCLFPIGFVLLASLCLHFGAPGGILSAYRRSKKVLANGVISGADRETFRDVCLKGAPASLKMAFLAFAEGEISAFAFSEKARESVKDRRAFYFGVYFGLSIALSVLVFLSFYFLCPLSEAFLRFAISLFFVTPNGAILFFLTHGYAVASEKAAVGLAELLDGKLLRVKPSGEDLYPALRYTGADVPSAPTESDERKTPEERREEKCGSDGELGEEGLKRLRQVLREIDMQNI